MEIDMESRNAEIKRGVRLTFLFILMVMGLSQLLAAILPLSTQIPQMIGLALGAVIALLGRLAPEKGTLLKDKNEMTGSSFVVLLGAFMLAKLLSLLASVVLMRIFVNDGNAEALEGISTVEDNLFLSFLFLGVVTPIAEEIVFRGCIGGSFRKYGIWFAMIMSTLLFALYHGNLFQLLSTFLPGIVLFYAALNYSVKWSVLLHFINNGLMTIGFMFLNKLCPGGLFAEYGEYAVECVLIIAALLLMKKDNAVGKVKAFLSGPENEKGVYKAAIGNIWFVLIVLFVAVLTGLMLLTLSGAVSPELVGAAA